MLCYWLTSNTFSLIQVLVLRIPAVRKFYKIEPLMDHKKNVNVHESDVPKMGFMDSFRESMRAACLIIIIIIIRNNLYCAIYK